MFTKKLSEFIFRTNYSDLPPEAISAAKIAVLDHIGVAMAGSQEPSGRIINQMVREYNLPAEATVIGHRYKTNPSMAALVNGTAAHVLDYDDCLDFPRVGLGHPSTSILPALMALAENNHLSGPELIIAYLVGIETYGKIGLMSKDAFKEGRRWEWTGVLGVMGATAAVAKILKLDESKINLSLGIAASLSCGIIRNFGSMAGHLHAGNAARNAIEAGILAQKGFTAYSDIFEAPYGFYNTFTANQDPLPIEVEEEHSKALGNPWNILNPGFMFKAFPCAHISHFGVTAGLQLRKQHSIDWKQISEIEFRIPSAIQKLVSYPDPKTGIQAKFSLGYCLCRALIEGKIKITHFADENINDPSTRQLMQKIKFVAIDQDMGDSPFGYQEVILKMRDGKTFSCRVDHSKGEPQNPQTYEEFTSKYLECAQHAHYDEKTASQIQATTLDLDNLKDVSQLAALIGR
jgi:2-methylcitrate dehydratase PrpD